MKPEETQEKDETKDVLNLARRQSLFTSSQAAFYTLKRFSTRHGTMLTPPSEPESPNNTSLDAVKQSLSRKQIERFMSSRSSWWIVSVALHLLPGLKTRRGS